MSLHQMRQHVEEDKGLATGPPCGIHGSTESTTLTRARGVEPTRQDIDSLPTNTAFRTKGKREMLLEKTLRDRISKEVLEKSSPIPPPKQYSTSKQAFFHYTLKPEPPVPNKAHDYHTEQPITYWSNNVNNIQGVTDIKSREKPFLKNTTFSKPISERLDTPF
uniref:Sperm-associated antigen 8-like isoform X1 n=2 Tax=Petromyzon marinus TaxID=7757 RepID=A0AAJ7XBR8_PETMA|nr:sperm-associated antigen 8-like isoform X1 [Petromyzon marinus]XP_032828618.1 sperm-associated antigen 8-like isoform X1 [Petromyzon marinus]